MRRGLLEELKQARPFKCLEEEVFLNIARTSALLEHAFAQSLKPYGITSTQYNVLRILRGAGAEGLCRNEIGNRLVRPVPDVTRLLDRLEEMHLVSRERTGADRRYVTTRIARQGLDLLAQLDDEIAGMHQRELGHVDRRSLRALIETLTAIRRPD
ncbi:MAG: MarR family winged helix-turn-helix transcriptional regulator [Bacteroidales bacterium]